MTDKTTRNAGLTEDMQELALTPRLLVALDFDGTVSPFVDDPYEARVTPDAVGPIKRLEALNETWVAYVSGRPLASLSRVTDSDDGALLIGSHGVEIRLDGSEVDLALDGDERRRLELLGAALATIVERTPGSVLEHKPVGYGVHTRLVPPARTPAVLAEARTAAEGIGGFVAREGKDILEFAVRVATKGDGIEHLRQHVGASAVLYAGDDVTDEDGFAALRPGDVGIKVGEGETLATHRVKNVHAMAEVLRLLAGRREISQRD